MELRTVVDEDLTHAAAGRGQRHLDLDPAPAIVGMAQAAFVDQAEVDDVDAQLGVDHVTEGLFDVLKLGDLGRRGGLLRQGVSSARLVLHLGLVAHIAS